MTLDRVELFENTAERSGGAVESTGRKARLILLYPFFHHNIAGTDVCHHQYVHMPSGSYCRGKCRSDNGLAVAMVCVCCCCVAVQGGAVSVRGGEVVIKQGRFVSNRGQKGGVLAVTNGALATVERSKFHLNA